jgi:hypothetical protein
MAELYTAMLVDWKIEDNYGLHRIVGTIAGDDVKGRFKSGERIFTSPIRTINFDTMIAWTKSGSIYKLSD